MARPKKSGPLYEVLPNGCWSWLLCQNGDGYGYYRFRDLSGKAGTLPHRYFFELENGPIPPGKQIDHICFNRKCVNPAHLRLVTSAVNSKRAALLGRERGSKSKLTWDEVREIRRLHGTMTDRALGMRFGVAQSTVNEIVHNKKWKALTAEEKELLRGA